MVKFGRFIIVSDVEELKKDAIWVREDSIRAKGGVFHIKKAVFPQCFEYQEPFDLHFCGDYFPCPLTKMIRAINKRIKELEKIKKEVDKLKTQ